MGEVFNLEKYGQLWASVFTAGGSFTVWIDKQLDGLIRDSIELHPVAYKAISYMLIVFFALHLIWFAINIYLKTKERFLGIREKEVEIEKDKKELDLIPEKKKV